MNKLNQLHYLPVFLKPVSGRVVLFNPVFQNRWKENLEFLERLKLPEIESAYLNNNFFLELERPSRELPQKEGVENLLSFALESISLPSKLTDKEYFQITQGHYLAVTEKFLSRHVCGHVAASRHVLLKDLQIKGVGRTASTQQLSYPNMNGFIRTSEAVRGYYNAMLLHSSLPHGSVKLHGVICVIDERLHSSLVIRDAQTHRLAQIEPVFLNQEDRETLRQEVLHSFGTNDRKTIIQRVLEQHLCLWMMGVEHPMTVDNLALAGFPMDEEDMRPGWDMQQLTLDFTIKFSSDCPTVTNFDDLLRETFECSGGFSHRLKHLVVWYEECLNWILQETGSIISVEEKLTFIQETLNGFYESQDVDAFLKICRWLEERPTFTKDELRLLLKDLEYFSVSPTVTDLKMQVRHTVLRLPLKMRLKDDLRGKFNREPRVSTEKVVSSFSRFEMDDHSHNSDTAFQNSNQLHRVANLQAFCLSSATSLKLNEIEEMISKLTGGYQLHSVTVFSESGRETLSEQDWSHWLVKRNAFVLLEVTILYEKKPFALPTEKKWIIPK